MTTKNLSVQNSFQYGGFTKRSIATSGLDTPAGMRSLGIYRENSYDATYLYEYRSDIRVKPYNSSVIENTNMGKYALLVSAPRPVTPDDAEAYGKILEKWRSNEFNAAVSAAESGESLRMISGRLTQLATCARSLRRGDLPAAARSLGVRPSRGAKRRLDSGDMSGAYLELRYGWIPLVGDIFAASELLTPRIGTPSVRTSKKVLGTCTNSLSSGFRQPEVRRSDLIVRHLVRLSSTEITWPERLGLADPFTIAWELVPFSFVVDWFVPIGDSLEALHATRVVPVGSYVRTETFRVDASLWYHPGDPLSTAPTSKIFVSSGVHAIYRTYMSRRVYSSLPTILVGNPFKKTGSVMDLSLRQVTDAFALAHQGLSSLIKR